MVEYLIVAQVVIGSIPILPPIYSLNFFSKMEKENLKKLGHELIDSLPNVQTSIVIVSDGSKSSALIAGVGGDIINSLANAMAEKKEFKRMVELAYLAVTNKDKS